MRALFTDCFIMLLQLAQALKLARFGRTTVSVDGRIAKQPALN